MFANLKNKLIEEVKASPSKFQQFAAAVSSSASTTPSGSESTATTTTTNENFFSITEEDTPQNSPYKPLKLPPGAARGRVTTPQALNNGAGGSTGAIPRTRKLSNSSMASDVSFRLPAYDSPPVYHLQSDLESNCSELEDTASTAKLDVITKEQLYDAYRKSLERYHKYRCRYTDLAKKYKDLERDSTKARSVLVETQEKAIRRISELREQCTLEQQAKAHLEEALRIEMDDMQCKMQAYETKLKLLGENPENVTTALAATANETTNESLIDLDNGGVSAKTAQSNLINLDVAFGDDNIAMETKIANLERQLKERDQQVRELNEQMIKSETTIEMLRKQEEENALLLAQTKQAIHSELENKESEVKQLTDTVKKLQSDLQTATKKETQLSGQVVELKELRDKLKQLQTTKQEADAKVIATEHMLSKLREEHRAKEEALTSSEQKLAVAVKESEEKLQEMRQQNAQLTSAEQKLAGSLKESEQKLQDLRQQNAQLSDMVQRYQQNEVSLAEIDNELNRTKNENDNLKADISEHERRLRELEQQVKTQEERLSRSKADRADMEQQLSEAVAKAAELERQLQQELARGEMQNDKIEQFESELRILNEQHAQNESETIAALKAELHKRNAELSEQLNTTKEQLVSKEKEVKSQSNKLNKQKKQHEAQQGRIKEQSDEIEKLKVELNKHEQQLAGMLHDAQQREEQAEHEKNALKTQVNSILHEIGQMEEQMRVVRASHGALEEEKRALEEKIEKMQKQARDTSDGKQRWREQLAEQEEQLRQVETKLQNVESESTQLAEKNCLLEESSNRLEKLLAERERQQVVDETNANELRLKLETAEDAIQKLNEKMSQVLDENSRMHNAQELMDHDYRTLQDKYDALEKEKLLADDARTCLQAESGQLKERKATAEAKLLETVEQLQQQEENLAEQKKKLDSAEEQLRELQAVRVALEKEKQLLQGQVETLRTLQSDDEKLQQLLQDRQRCIEELQQELGEKELTAQMALAAMEQENKSLKQIGQTLEQQTREQDLLREQNESLKRELEALKDELSGKSATCAELEMQLQDLERLKTEQSQAFNDKVQRLNDELEEQKKAQCAQQQAEQKLREQLECVSANSAQLESTQSELQHLRDEERRLHAELAASGEHYALQLKELEGKLATASSDVERLHESNDAFQVEIDQLTNKHDMQLQSLGDELKQLREANDKLHSQVSTAKVDAEKLAGYEEMQVENEYLNKSVQLLEQQLAQQREEMAEKTQEGVELRDKLKSLQCELYVLRENAEKYDAQLAEKQQVASSTSAECHTLKESLAAEREELQRQTAHANYITEQNDAIQKELLHTQQQLEDVQQKLQLSTAELESLKAASSDSESQTKELAALRAEVEQNRVASEALKTQLQAQEQLQQQLDALRVELAERSIVQLPVVVTASEAKASVGDAEHLRRINETLQRELEELKHKSSTEIDELQQQIEDLQNNNKHLSERMMELERLRAGMQAQQLLFGTPHTPAGSGSATVTEKWPGVATSENVSDSSELEKDFSAMERLEHEKAELVAKMQEIDSDVRAVSERNMFLEQQCENYLILEQSNERLKLQNAKLARQLDETLVSMQHNENISANTEFEYLKNIMFQYLTGSANGNNETLVKVISAVLKFSPQQTQVALEKEHQRRSLINKIL